jgi:hypothetical protein
MSRDFAREQRRPSSLKFRAFRQRLYLRHQNITLPPHICLHFLDRSHHE